MSGRPGTTLPAQLADKVRALMADGCEFSCGCEHPGDPAKCIYPETFAALDQLVALASEAEQLREERRGLEARIERQRIELANANDRNRRGNEFARKKAEKRAERAEAALRKIKTLKPVSDSRAYFIASDALASEPGEAETERGSTDGEDEYPPSARASSRPDRQPRSVSALPSDPNTRAWLGIEPQFPEPETETT